MRRIVGKLCETVGRLASPFHKVVLNARQSLEKISIQDIKGKLRGLGLGLIINPILTTEWRNVYRIICDMIFLHISEKLISQKIK